MKISIMSWKICVDRLSQKVQTYYWNNFDKKKIQIFYWGIFDKKKKEISQLKKDFATQPYNKLQGNR